MFAYSKEFDRYLSNFLDFLDFFWLMSPLPVPSILQNVKINKQLISSSISYSGDYMTISTKKSRDSVYFQRSGRLCHETLNVVTVSPAAAAAQNRRKGEKNIITWTLRESWNITQTQAATRNHWRS